MKILGFRMTTYMTTYIFLLLHRALGVDSSLLLRLTRTAYAFISMLFSRLSENFVHLRGSLIWAVSTVVSCFRVCGVHRLTDFSWRYSRIAVVVHLSAPLHELSFHYHRLVRPGLPLAFWHAQRH